MRQILRTVANFQIFKSIVRLVTIPVIHILMAERANEGFHNDAVDQAIMTFASNAKSHRPITGRVGLGLEDSASASGSVADAPYSLRTHDLSLARNGVMFWKLWIRAPFLVHGIQDSIRWANMSTGGI